MEYHGTWKEIWEQKGKMEGTIADLYIYDGWEKSKANVEITAKKYYYRTGYSAGR